jgi:undecaprenyl-diphosphatase
VAEVAIEALGGEPPDAARPAVTPAAAVLPRPLADRVRAFDARVDRAFDTIRGNPVADRIMYGASALGDFSLVWHLVGVGRAVRGGRTHEREAARLAAALLVESALVNVGVKSLFRRTRPAWDQHRPRRLRRPRSSSFPSGHATSGFMAATLLSTGGRRSRMAWFGLAAVVASSRVHVRIHHGSDVAAGALIGIGLGRLARRLWNVSPPGNG